MRPTATIRETEDLLQRQNPIEVRELLPGEEEAWDQFILRSEGGTFFHLSGWKNVIEKTLGHRCCYLVALGNSGISGVLPLSLVQNRLFGDCLVSVPLAVYGGICTQEPEAYFALLAASKQLAIRHGVRYVELRNRTESFSSGLPGRDLYVTFTQDLSPGPERLFQMLPRDTRYMIRKSQKADLRWVEDLTLDEFYDIYARTVHRLGTPVFSRELLVDLQREFPRSCRLFGVRKGKRAIAGVFCLYFRNQVLPYYGGALLEFFRDSPNNFMYWNLMVQSCQEGHRYFDFGRSKKGSGSFIFKSAWSMKMDELPYQYQLVRSQEIPHLSSVDKKFQLPIAIWKRLPLEVTKLLGPKLFRWVPSV